jgi:hypothetical protein
MNENSQRPRVAAVMIAAVAFTLTACSATTPPAPAPSTVTVTAMPPPTVTVTPSPSSSPTVTTAPPPAGQFTGTGAFQSPSGNIHCALSSHGGQSGVQCESTTHTWTAPPKAAECHLNWGSRLELHEGGDPDFACYG